MSSYRVVLHGFPTRADARGIAGVFALQTVAAQIAGVPSAATLTISVEPDDVETAEVDPAIDPVEAAIARVDVGTTEPADPDPPSGLVN